jgi:hypothetical protein
MAFRDWSESGLSIVMDDQNWMKSMPVIETKFGVFLHPNYFVMEYCHK